MGHRQSHTVSGPCDFLCGQVMMQPKVMLQGIFLVLSPTKLRCVVSVRVVPFFINLSNVILIREKTKKLLPVKLYL